jgi:hypothetical protein
MARYTIFIILFIALTLSPAQERAALVLGIPLLMQRNNVEMELPTLDSIDTLGKVLYRLDKASAVCVAILVEAGYAVYARSQIGWYLYQPGEVPNISPKEPYRESALASVFLSPHLVRRIEKVEARKTEGGMQLTLHYVRAGFSRYEGRCDLLKEPQPMVLTQDDVQVFVGATFDMGARIMRRIEALYLLLGRGETPKEVTGVLEKEMTKLKLDASYRMPEFTMIRYPIPDAVSQRR